MEAELVEKLSRINEFSDELVNILTAIIRDIHRPAWDSHTSKLAVILVNFTCQPKISYMRKSPSATIAINNANKTLEDYCMDLILQLLLKMLKLKDDMVHKLTELFLEVIEMNINNVDAIVLLYRAMFFSEKVVNYILENNYLGIFIEQYEKIINQILREFDNTERSTFVSETLRSYFYGGSDFYSNLSKHAQAIGNLHPFELNSGNNLNIPEEDFDTNTPNVNVMHTPHDPLGGQAGTNNPNSEQSSFYLPQGAAVNYGSSAKSVKIPILNLPASFNDGNVNTVSRSTRRADPYKSFSTNSNRLSNYGVGSSSIDYGAAKDSTFQKQINENNISILENENSYMYEENLNKTGVYQSAQEKMKHLASQLGEFCLTIDLGCLLAQNRKLQLDRVAKVAVYQDVDTIMDFKAEEKILREKFRKKKHKSTKKGKLSRKSAGLGLGMNPEIKEVESSENSECSDAEGHGAKEENKATPQKAHSRKSADRSDKKSDKQAARNKKMQELKQSWKASHVLANILLLLLKEVEYEKLQQYGSLVNIMYLALSTDISQRFRLKEKAKLSLSMNYWIDNMDDEFNKHEELCEGIDNVERINRHFEKTLVDKYKARQAHIQQNNAIGNIAANIPNNPNQPVVPSHFSGNAPHVNNPNFSLNNNLSHHPNAPGHASTLKSFTIGGNDSKKKGNLGQKSLTFFDMNTTNMKYFDSTVLHFSTTYDNTNSSAITIPDESIDSLDELNTNQNLMNLDFILLPENVVYFKILDLFSVVSEKVHETLTTKYQNAFEVEKLIDDPTSALSETSVPFSQPKPKSQTEKDKLLDITNLVSKHPDNSHFKIFIKGLYMNPAEDYNTKVIKKKVNLFLHKYEKKLTWILNQVDMNSVFFYDMEVEQLEILEGYLSSSTSKVTVFEVLENVFELLLLIKKQILDLSTSFLGGQGGTNTTTTRIASPNLTAKAYRPGSITREFPTPSAPTSSTNIANNILKSVLKTNPSSRNMPANDLSPQRVISEDKEKPRSATVYSPSFSNSFIYKQKALFTSYLGIITRLITRAPSSNVYTLMNDVFASSENWMELVKLFTVSIFREVTAICERIGDSNQIPIEKEQIQLFIYAKKILEYYTSILVMCNVTIFKEKLNTGPVEAEKKKWKNTLRKILQSMLYLVKPNGVLANYIQTNTNLNSTIINPRIQSLSNYNLIRIHLFKSIYDFLRKVFSFDSRFSCFLGEDIVTFYIRFSYINFVKLYSHSSNSELNEINRKIAEIGNRVKSKAGQENFNENIDRLENEFNRRNPKPGNNEMKNYQIHLSKLYIKVLLAIAKNRTENINHKFYQYRILEFFTREIDLEFDISQIRERFLRIRNELKRMAEKKEQEGSSQPPQPQPLRIPARTATVEEPEEESKERQDTYQSDVRVTNISDADGQSKKFSIPGLRMSPGLGPLPYHLHKGAGHKEGIFTIEENNNQRSYLSEEFANSHMVEPIPNASETPSPKSTTLQKKNARTKSNPFGQEEMLDVPKLYSQMDITPPFGDSQAENDPFDQSNISNDNRSPHVVFQKRFAIPSLNLHGHTSSYYTGGAGSIGNSPFKTEMPKTLFEAESELQQEEKKFTLNLQKAHGPEGKRKSQVEQISELELNDDRSSVTGEHMEQHGQYRADKTIQNKLKGVIKQELGLRKVVSSSKQQEPKQSTKLDASSQRKMRTSLASIDNEKLSVQSRRRLELNEQKEGGVGSTRRTVSRQEISDREFTNQPSSKRTVGSRMSPIRPVQIQEVRQEEDIDRQKGFYVDPNVEEQKFETEGMNDMHDTVVVNEEEEPNQHEMSNQYPGAPPIETERTDGMSDISMGEMIQREMEYKKALAEQQKGKKTIPSLKLPSFLVEKGNLYGVDAKYAGSPRDVDEHSDKEEEKEHVRPSMRMNESLQSQGNHNPFAKKLKVPSLKIGGLGGNKEEMIYRPHHEDLEKLQDSYTLGNLTQLEHSLNASNPKMQLLLEGKRKHHSPKMNLKNLTKEFSLNNANMDETLTENLFYYSERKLRKLYEDDELHVLVISLMVTLLLSPNRGTLDEYYTSQYPIDDNKPNILYIMHFHLNHASNQHILPLLLQKMAEVKPFPAGQRLLKLLCISFSDMSIYTDKKKIGGGAYGTIFECNTNLADPRTVAIKETKFPSSIHDRCALHDIFNEIACLEQFRLDPAVTDIYDYGVTDSSYIIVMKKYPFSLKDWRLKQEGNWMDHLPTYLTIYRDILKAIAMLHDNNITHYDLKCDNILLDSKTNNTMKWNSESDIRVVLGDFGECKMFTNEQEELCLRNRGTEYIKSPEMLTLTINCKRENDNFDRRRKVGTTRASDIWSLGCLLYEILTGDFLFYDTDWIRFYIRVTSPNETLLTEERLSKIQNNNYIVDFLKYILVRDPHHRPSIHHVLARFEHIHALLVSNLSYVDHNALTLAPHSVASNHASLEGTLESYVELLFSNQEAIQEKVTVPHKLKHPPTYIKLMEEISICSKTYFLTNTDKLVRNRITHVVTTSNLIEEKYLSRFKYMLIQLTDDQRLHMLPYILAPQMMDYLRVVFLYKGNILFVEDDNISINSKASKLVLRTSLLFCLTHFFKCSVYETWALLNSQVLFFSLPFAHLSMMSNLMIHHLKLAQLVQALPKIQCICGCCTIILKRHFTLEKNINVKPCACSRESKNIDYSDCPSDGCHEYIKYMKEKYKMPWDLLKWGYFGANDFFIGPKGTGVIQDKFHCKVILNSEGVLENSMIYQKKYRKPNTSYASLGNPNKDKWDLYQCKFCMMWLFAENKLEGRYAVVTNNKLNPREGGIMTPHPRLGSKIKTPTLRNFKLADLI